MGVVDEWSSILKTRTISSRQGSTPILCQAMGKFEAMNLISAINNERKKRRLSAIPASDDMCTTALFKGLVQKVGLRLFYKIKRRSYYII